MDDGELDFSNQEIFSGANIGDIPGNCSLDSFFDEVFKEIPHACTHTHTCNPPGPDSSHTHTCFHVHTKIVSTPSEDNTGTDDAVEESVDKKRKRPLGNREAVRKYREKKKARAASLEEEVVKLRAINQQLFKRLQGQAALEAEVARLKCLLVDIRGRIDGEIGSFPYQKSASTVNLANQNVQGGGYLMNPCNLPCNDEAYCLHPGVDGKSGDCVSLSGHGFDACDLESLQCLVNQNSGMKDLSGCENENVETNGGSSVSVASKRKGRARTNPGS